MKWVPILSPFAAVSGRKALCGYWQLSVGHDPSVLLSFVTHHASP